MYLRHSRRGNQEVESVVLAEQLLGATLIPTREEELETGCWDTSADRFKYDPEYPEENRSRDEDW